MNNLTGKIRVESDLHGTIAMPVGYKDYEGPYEIIPKTMEQKLSTADKHMVKDVSVKAIPFYSVDNINNGQTIIIGGDTDGSK